MIRLEAISVIAIAWFAVATCQIQFPCDSLLRHLPAFSQFFAHCECQYTNWTEWATPVNASPIPVPRNQCNSTVARPEERWRTVISGDECEDTRDERHICVVYCV